MRLNNLALLAALAAALPATATVQAFAETAAKPDAPKPDATKADAAKPDAAKPPAAKPEAAKPEAAKDDEAGSKTSDADKRARATDCSIQADAKKLRGEARKKFRSACKRGK